MNLKNYDLRRLTVFIVCIFIGESFLLDALTPLYDHLSKNLQKLIDVLGLFGALSLVFLILKLYDEKLWKLFPSWLNLVSTPDVNGKYSGKLKSSFLVDGVQVERIITMEIHQKASSIFIEMEFSGADGKVTKSGSHSECFEKHQGKYHLLQFIHQNEGSFDDTNLNIHTGLTSLKYLPEKGEFIGTYFNDPHRKTHGTIKVKRVN